MTSAERKRAFADSVRRFAEVVRRSDRTEAAATRTGVAAAVESAEAWRAEVEHAERNLLAAYDGLSDLYEQAQEGDAATLARIGNSAGKTELCQEIMTRALRLHGAACLDWRDAPCEEPECVAKGLAHTAGDHGLVTTFTDADHIRDKLASDAAYERGKERGTS